MKSNKKEKLVTVVGGSGFVGRHLVQRLVGEGWRVRVAVRRPHEVPELTVSGEIGQVQVVQANVRNADSIRAAVAGSDAVINLVGLLYQYGPQKFGRVHVEGAHNVAEEAAKAGVKTLIHMSALGASKTSASLYSRTKADGEKAVRSVFEEAIVLRPSVVFGSDDKFYSHLASLVRMTVLVPDIGSGKTKFQPLYIDDLVDGLVAALSSVEAQGRTFELGGPEVVTLAEVLRTLAKEMGRPRLFFPLPFWVAKLDAWFLQLVAKLRIRPLLTVDQVRLLQSDNVVTGEDARLGTLADLGVTDPVGPSALLPGYMTRFRKRGQFEERPTVKA